jgi:hypothetical protein
MSRIVPIALTIALSSQNRSIHVDVKNHPDVQAWADDCDELKLVELELDIIPGLLSTHTAFGNTQCAIGVVKSRIFNGNLNANAGNAFELPYVTTHYFQPNERVRIQRKVSLEGFNLDMMTVQDQRGNDPFVIINANHTPAGTTDLWTGRIILKLEIKESVFGKCPF